MRKKNYKGRCEKKTIDKCKTVCKTYDPIQSAYVDILDQATQHYYSSFAQKREGK